MLRLTAPTAFLGRYPTTYCRNIQWIGSATLILLQHLGREFHISIRPYKLQHLPYSPWQNNQYIMRAALLRATRRLELHSARHL